MTSTVKLGLKNNKEVFIGMEYNKKDIDASVQQSLERIIGVKKLLFNMDNNMDNLGIAAFANWNESDFDKKIEQIRSSVPGIKIVKASFLE
jgi:hypothetical protein